MSVMLTVSDIDIWARLRHTVAVDRLYRQFGNRLRESRLDAKLTQDEVAERVGLKRTSITNIECGRQHIALHQLFLLADAVGVGPIDLLPDNETAMQELRPDQLEQLRAASEDDEGFAFARRVVSKGQTQTEGRAE